MIISKTPFRLSLFGGGTDYPKWYQNHGGAVIGLAVDKYCYLSVRRLPQFFEHKHRFVYSKIETVKTLEEFIHPAAKAVLQHYYPEVGLGLEIHHDGDLPARSGLGSSSSFVVGLINAVLAMKGQRVSKYELAMAAIHVEQNIIKENVGSQDQCLAAFGGLNRINFNQDGTIVSEPIVLSAKRRTDLIDHLVMFFTGESRFASEMAAKQLANFDDRAEELHTIQSLVFEAESIIYDSSKPIALLGELLHQSWLMKQRLADTVSNPRIDELYERARKAGAVGGKLMGAGGGGFLLFVCPPEKRESLRRALPGLVEVSVGIDQEGSRIALYEPEGL